MKKYLVTVGTEKDRTGKSMDKKRTRWILKRALAIVAYEYGGATMRHGTGVWGDEIGKLVTEKSVTIESIDTRGRGPEVAVKIASYLRAALNQAAVVLESVEVDAKII